MGILFIYISTDYVFDGSKPPYKIEDQPNPLNNYGITKYEGEKVTIEASNGKSFEKYFFIIYYLLKFFRSYYSQSSNSLLR